MLTNIFTRLKNLFVSNQNDFEVIYIEVYNDTSYNTRVKSVQYAAMNRKNGTYHNRYLYSHQPVSVEKLTEILNRCGPVGKKVNE